jgi:hypothetical protein
MQFVDCYNVLAGEIPTLVDLDLSIVKIFPDRRIKQFQQDPVKIRKAARSACLKKAKKSPGILPGPS